MNNKCRISIINETNSLRQRKIIKREEINTIAQLFVIILHTLSLWAQI